jgi:hypothetical protein
MLVIWLVHVVYKKYILWQYGRLLKDSNDFKSSKVIPKKNIVNPEVKHIAKPIKVISKTPAVKSVVKPKVIKAEPIGGLL